MRALQKIIRHGNACGISIPRPLMVHLGWLPGESVMIELLEDSTLRVRRPIPQDFAPIHAPRLFPPMPPETK